MDFINEEESRQYYAREMSEFEYKKRIELEKRQKEIEKYLPRKKK